MPDIFQAYTLEQVVGTGIAILVILAGIVSTVFVIWGGFLMIISAGNEEKVKSAVNHIRHAFMGVALIVIILFVFPIFVDLVNVDYANAMRPRAVFQSIGALSDRIFGKQIQGDSLEDPSYDNGLPSNYGTLPF